MPFKIGRDMNFAGIDGSFDGIGALEMDAKVVFGFSPISEFKSVATPPSVETVELKNKLIFGGQKTAIEMNYN